MIPSPIEKTDTDKAVKRLIATWKKNHEIRNKALLLMQMNPAPKIKRIDRPFILRNALDFSKARL